MWTNPKLATWLRYKKKSLSQSMVILKPTSHFSQKDRALKANLWTSSIMQVYLTKYNCLYHSSMFW